MVDGAIVRGRPTCEVRRCEGRFRRPRVSRRNLATPNYEEPSHRAHSHLDPRNELRFVCRRVGAAPGDRESAGDHEPMAGSSGRSVGIRGNCTRLAEHETVRSAVTTAMSWRARPRLDAHGVRRERVSSMRSRRTGMARASPDRRHRASATRPAELGLNEWRSIQRAAGCKVGPPSEPHRPPPKSKRADTNGGSVEAVGSKSTKGLMLARRSGGPT